MTAQFPGSIPTYTNPTAAMTLGSAGHDALHANANDDIVELARKAGTGVSTPDAIYKSLMASAAGVTDWGYHTSVKFAEVSGTGASGVLEITGIPSTHRNLIIKYLGRSTAALVADDVNMTFEASATVGAYDYQRLEGISNIATAVENIGTLDYLFVGRMPAGSSTANLHGSATIEVREYANTAVMKPVQSKSCSASNLVSAGLGDRELAGVYENLAAISRVRLTLVSGSWTTTSRMAVYLEP